MLDRVTVAALLAALPVSSFAGGTVTVPEPGLLALLGVAGAVGVIVAIRRRK